MVHSKLWCFSSQRNLELWYLLQYFLLFLLSIRFPNFGDSEKIRELLSPANWNCYVWQIVRLVYWSKLLFPNLKFDTGPVLLHESFVEFFLVCKNCWIYVCTMLFGIQYLVGTALNPLTLCPWGYFVPHTTETGNDRPSLKMIVEGNPYLPLCCGVQNAYEVVCVIGEGPLIPNPPS